MIYNILNTGKTGLKAMQNDLDNTAHNIANSNTTGYKKKNTSFQELLMNESDNVSTSAGVKNGVHTVNYSQGNMVSTGEETDFAIEGEGFFGLRDEDGRLILTRNGNFKLDGNNELVNSSGKKVNLGFYTDEETGIEYYGPILYRPESMGDLLPIDETSFYLGENSNMISSLDGEVLGKVKQGYLEGSNVDMSQSMIDLITTQRAYSVNGKMVQTTEDIMMMINGLKR